MAIKYELLYGNTNKLLKINAEYGDKILMEAGAMVGMSPTFDIKSKAGSLGKAIGRLFAGESMFQQEYTAKADGEVLLAPKYLGDIQAIEMDGTAKYRLGKTSFLACAGGVNLNIKSGGGKGFLSGEGIVQIEAEGIGTLFVAAYGAIHEKVLDYNEQYIVDTNQLVLWNSNMEYSVELSNGVLGSITGGEGLVCVFKGPGKILMQTRDPLNMVSKSK